MLHDPIQALRDASRNLLYPSETDAPFSVFSWRGTRGTAADALTHYVDTRDHRVSEVAMQQFFAELSDGDGAERFAQMQQVLEQELYDLQVFRVGEGPKIEIYVVGRAANGEWIGVHTTSVET